MTLGDGRVVCPECGFLNHPTEAFEPWSLESDSALHSIPNIGRFEIRSCVGEGGFGIVFEAWDTELHRRVAIKLPRNIRDSNRGMFLREARAASKLRHPNIVSVYDIGTVDGQVYIVSEFVAGVTLATWLRHEDCDLDTSCEISLKICKALEYAHQNGVVHRDLKPGK